MEFWEKSENNCMMPHYQKNLFPTFFTDIYIYIIRYIT